MCRSHPSLKSRILFCGCLMLVWVRRRWSLCQGLCLPPLWFPFLPHLPFSSFRTFSPWCSPLSPLRFLSSPRLSPLLQVLPLLASPFVCCALVPFSTCVGRSSYLGFLPCRVLPRSLASCSWMGIFSGHAPSPGFSPGWSVSLRSSRWMAPEPRVRRLRGVSEGPQSPLQWQVSFK